MRRGAGGAGGNDPSTAWRSRRDHPSHPVAPAAPSGPQWSGVVSPDLGGARSELLHALMEFRWSHLAGPYSAAAEVSSLLDLWGLASAVDGAVARPIERMLTALVQRTLVTSDELARCLDEVRWALTDLPA
jgi:hypothetical protein